MNTLHTRLINNLSLNIDNSFTFNSKIPFSNQNKTKKRIQIQNSKGNKPNVNVKPDFSNQKNENFEKLHRRLQIELLKTNINKSSSSLKQETQVLSYTNKKNHNINSSELRLTYDDFMLFINNLSNSELSVKDLNTKDNHYLYMLNTNISDYFIDFDMKNIRNIINKTQKQAINTKNNSQFSENEDETSDFHMYFLLFQPRTLKLSQAELEYEEEQVITYIQPSKLIEFEKYEIVIKSISNSLLYTLQCEDIDDVYVLSNNKNKYTIRYNSSNEKGVLEFVFHTSNDKISLNLCVTYLKFVQYCKGLSYKRIQEK